MESAYYAYQLPKSVAQQQYLEQRRAAIAAEQRRRLQPDGGLTATPLADLYPYGAGHRRENSDMEHPRTSSSTSSSQGESAHHSLLNNPFELRHGRRYLRELPYPLPVDLNEMQRQNLRTLLCCQTFGRAICALSIDKTVPKRVLEIGCGSGYWSAMCHDYFSSRGYDNVSFTGLDVAPLAPNMDEHGMKWTFVQHDLRRIPYPFDDEQFDLVMIKDMSLVLPLGMASERFFDECIRILEPGGTLEIWESEHVLRSLLPHPPPPTKNAAEQRAATNSATFIITPGTPFAPAQSKYLQQANGWIQEALDRRKLPPTPCARIAPILLQEPETLGSIGMRRIAIPLGELRWEREYERQNPHDSVISSKGKGKVLTPSSDGLTADQAALRQVALLTVLQFIENLEPLLKETSGKNTEEWSHWWAVMMADLLDPAKTSLTGECLEIGAWWATKLEDQSG